MSRSQENQIPTMAENASAASDVSTFDPLAAVIIGLCLIFVFAMQFNAFGKSGKTRTLDSVASFFLINEIIDKWQRFIFATIASIPLSFIFLIVAYRAEVFIKALMESYGIAEATQAAAVPAPFVAELIKHIPSPLLPVVILVLLFLIFGAQIKFLYQRIERGVIQLAAIGHRTNSLSRALSRRLLMKWKYEDIVRRLELRRQKTLPLAEELEDASPDLKLSFQLIHMAKFDIPRKGLRGAFQQLVDDYLQGITEWDVAVDDRPPSTRGIELLPPVTDNINHYHIFATAMMFVIVCALYTGISPAASKFFNGLGIMWPHYDFIGSHIQTVVQMVLATIAPMIIGIILFVKRMERRKETMVQTVTVVFVIVFLSSLLINAPFAFQQRLEISLDVGELKATVEHGFGGRAELLYVLVHSLIPCSVVLVLAVIDPEETLSRWDIVITVGLITVGHFLAYMAFEAVAALEPWRYYWHQALLAFVLSTSALMIMRIFWKPPLQPRVDI